MVSSVSGAKGTGGWDILLTHVFGFRFHRDEQRVFVLFGQPLGRLDLGFRNVVRKNPRDTEARPVDVHHHGKRFGVRFLKNRLEHKDHEVLRRIVVVVQQHAPHTGTLQLLIAAGFSQRRFAWTVAQLPFYLLPFTFCLSFSHMPSTTSSSSVHGDAIGSSFDSRSTWRRNSDLGISRAPSDCRCVVASWQSTSSKLHRASCLIRTVSATFDASVLRLNIDSPKNMRPTATP